MPLLITQHLAKLLEAYGDYKDEQNCGRLESKRKLEVTSENFTSFNGLLINSIIMRGKIAHVKMYL